MTRLAAVMIVVAFVAVVLGVAIEPLRFLLVIAVVAIVVGVVAGFRGRNQPNVALSEDFDGPA